MAVNERYATASDLALRINRGDTWTADEAAVVSQLLADVSRLIDRYCRRHFWQSAAATARYFTAVSPSVLSLDDIASSSGLTVYTDEDGDHAYENTWATTDYDLEPYNAAEVYFPFTRIAVAPRGNYALPVRVPKGVKVTATWGWPEVPDGIREVALLEAARLWAQGKSPSGVVASPDVGSFMVEPELHPSAKVRLNQYKRVTIRCTRGG